MTILVWRRSRRRRRRASRLGTTAVVPQLLGRLREGDDEASGPPAHKRRLGGDPQVRGPAVPPIRQAEERKAVGDGRGRIAEYLQAVGMRDGSLCPIFARISAVPVHRIQQAQEKRMGITWTSRR